MKAELRGSVIVYGLYILTMYMQNSISLSWYIAAWLKETSYSGDCRHFTL